MCASGKREADHDEAEAMELFLFFTRYISLKSEDVEWFLSQPSYIDDLEECRKMNIAIVESKHFALMVEVEGVKMVSTPSGGNICHFCDSDSLERISHLVRRQHWKLRAQAMRKERLTVKLRRRLDALR